jgi:AraC-like DNA-binding protein
MEPSLKSIGIRYSHPPGYTVDRPSGSGDYLFLHFTVPIKILIADRLIQGTPHACIVYTPNYRQFYQGKDEGLHNSWFHFEGKELSPLFERYHIPVNTLFYPKYTEFIEPVLSEIRKERTRQEIFANHAIALSIETFFLKLSRSLGRSEEDNLSPSKLKLRETLRDIRQNFHDNLGNDWSVDKMAKKAHLSRSRFSALYREFFGASPIDDLIEARIEQAKWFLSSSQTTVSEVAYQSGFNNIYYFSRLFHKRVGCPPSEYFHKSMKTDDTPT